ncbi:hypothetical protein ACIP5U_39145 [Streptomyces sp. NPDC088788]|uniref:hypothetical protein n=1 Tax=Streptomyces sp. NPDC088788 TaxID=3365898 RepID=UPI0037F91638
MAQLAQQQESATRNGINALEQAFVGVQRSRQELEGTRNDSGLMGQVGGSYDKLLQQWDDQAEIISKNLMDMINELNTTLKNSGMTIGSTDDAVNQEYSRSQSVFNSLAG